MLSKLIDHMSGDINMVILIDDDGIGIQFNLFVKFDSEIAVDNFIAC